MASSWSRTAVGLLMRGRRLGSVLGGRQCSSSSSSKLPPPPDHPTASPASFFGSREPLHHPDPESEEEQRRKSNPFLNSDLSRRSSDIFSFNPDHIRQEVDEEKKHFRDMVSVYGEHRFGRPEHRIADRDYVASSDPEEWKFVEDLMPMELIPPIPVRDSYPSGFVPPTAKPGDRPYFVARTVHHMMPVYAEFNRKKMTLLTEVRKVDGNLFALRDDLDEFLEERYGMEFISQVAELYGVVRYRGDFEEDFKHFLLSKGF